MDDTVRGRPTAGMLLLLLLTVLGCCRFLFADIGGSPSLEAVPGEPRSILRADPAAWRREGFEVYRWRSLPDLLIFDTASYAVQADFFKRIAFYVEKSGFTGRLASSAALAEKKGYNAHNYRARDLARYFNATPPAGLSGDERLLLEVLLQNEVIGYTSRSYHPLRGGLISVSRSSDPPLRRLLLVHELCHAVFLSEAGYRGGAQRIWMTLSPAEQRFWSLFLFSRGYNVKDVNLVVNEYQAYLLQQPRSEVTAYFRNQIRLLKRLLPAYGPFLERFEPRYIGGFSETAAKLEELLRRPLSEGGDSFYTVRDELFGFPASEER